MRNKKIIFGILILMTFVVFLHQRIKQSKSDEEIIKEIRPFIGSIQNIVSTAGTVLPKNRLEIKPPVNGRIEEILIKEGEEVKIGQTLAWMSSTERAALLDAAGGQGEETLKYWKEVYKAISLISPIDGEVIVAKIQPGQTVTTSEPVLVLSDRLIVRAQVDETDIGKVKKGQNAIVTLDAYPDTKIKAGVEHIYYESKIVNNVTVYEVDLLPESVLPFSRSGMNATIDFIENSKENILLIPLEAVLREENEAYVLVKQADAKEPLKCAVKLGMSDERNAEIISGLDANETVIVKMKKYVLPQSSTVSNPLIPRPARGRVR